MCKQVPSSKLLGSPVRLHPEASETHLGSPGQPSLPSSQPPSQQTLSAAAAAPGPSSSGLLSAAQQLTQAPEPSTVEEQALQVLQAPVEGLGPQAPTSLPEEPQQPVSPLAVGCMTQVIAARACSRAQRTGLSRASKAVLRSFGMLED